MRLTSQPSDQFRWFSDLRVILDSSELTTTRVSLACRGERRGDHALSNFFTSSPCPPLPYTTPQPPNTGKHCETTTQGKRGTSMRLQATLPKLTSPPTRFRYKTKNCMALLTPAIHQDCLSESFLGEAQVTEGGGTDIARPSIHTPMMHQTRARLSTQNHTPNPQN